MFLFAAFRLLLLLLLHHTVALGGSPVGPTLDPALDPRALANGAVIGNITTGYSDQPNCLVRRDNVWVCTVTCNDKPEGSDGEHVITTISKDQGATWSPRYRVEPGQRLQHAYSTLFHGPGSSLYVTFIENSANVTTLNGQVETRRDMYGHFFMRRSLDGGKTWGGKDERWEIPVRKTRIDLENSWQGKVQMMWAVDKGFQNSNGTYMAFAKVGTYVVNPPTSAWLLHSPNLATEVDPAKVDWTLLPEGDDGIHNWQPTAPGISEEGHVVPMWDGRLYFVFRTDEGVVGARTSSDGGKSWQLVESVLDRDAAVAAAAVAGAGDTSWLAATPAGEPQDAAQYWADPLATAHHRPTAQLQRSLKNPRGPITPRFVGNLGHDTQYVEAMCLASFYTPGIHPLYLYFILGMIYTFVYAPIPVIHMYTPFCTPLTHL